MSVRQASKEAQQRSWLTYNTREIVLLLDDGVSPIHAPWNSNRPVRDTSMKSRLRDEGWILVNNHESE